MTLGEILTRLEGFDEGSFILVSQGVPVSPTTRGVVVPIPEDPGADLGVPGFGYWIEVYHAKDVLETWSAWRNGRGPSPEEAIAAITFFQEHDTYLPTEEMKQNGT